MAGLFRLLPLFVFFVVAGCAIQPVTSSGLPSASSKQHLANIADIKDFSIDGRIGIQTDGHGVSGRLNWQHVGEKDNISLYSPMGGKIASIVTTDFSITLTSSEGKIYTANDAEALTQQTLGWSLPVTSLSDWMVGRPTKGAIEKSSWDDAGKLIKLTQNGWEIEYQEYSEVGGHQLPGKLSLRSSKLYMKLIIERWDAPISSNLTK